MKSEKEENQQPKYFSINSERDDKWEAIRTFLVNEKEETRHAATNSFLVRKKMITAVCQFL